MATLSRARSAGKSSGAPNLLARCMELVEGHAHAALLLMRILFWMPRATVRHGGYTFVAKSREEWAVEIGISFDRCKRALAELRRLGLVATEQHKFGRRNVNHVRLTGRALDLLPTPGERGGSAPPKRRKPAPPERCTSAPLSIQVDTYSERQHRDCVLAHAGGLGEDSSRDSGEKNSNQAQSQSPSVEPERTGKNEGKLPTEIGVKPESVAALEQIWKTRITENYDGFVPDWTSKERGQIRQFRKMCPPGAAVPVLEACLGDWAVFAAMAKSNAGAWNLPSRPTVAFLVRFAGVAVNFWQAEIRPKVPPKPKPNPQQTPAQPIVDPAPGEKASLQDVMAAVCEMSSLK